ncbi:MAG: alpha/beta fold hydrolase [Pelolinea sp.]|nr:alpha/beta fold hydrolase [Pelolinea sp.]
MKKLNKILEKLILKTIAAAILIMLITAGCAPPMQEVELPTPVHIIQAYTPTITPTIIPTITPTPTINPLVTLTPTPDPFQDLYLDSLKNRSYGGGVLQNEGVLNGADGFSRRLFKYRSEGLDLYGFINIPEGGGPFPIIFLLHGYVDPAKYNTLDYSVRYADALARNGYITIHPNLRGYAPSQNGENILGIGDSIDLLNLIALVRQQSGSAGLLEKADSSRVGLWGHSMGGGIVMRALIVDQGIDAGLLYASIHSNEEFNLFHFEKDGRGIEKVIAPASALANMSPFNFLNDISAPISVHHGGLDDVVPVQWSRNLCETLQELGKEVKCREYPDQPHTFKNSGDLEFINEMIAFFDEFVK